jgi:hypothetical protein
MALPKYPELKSSLEKMVLNYFETKAREELGPFRDVRRFTQHEGRKLIHNTQDDTGKRKETAFKEAKVEYAFKYEDVINMKPEDVLELITVKAKEFGGQQLRINYQVLDETTKEAGNVVDAGGKPLTIDLFLDTISKISIDFDKFGNPQMPTMVIPESQSDKYRKLIEEAENDETAKQRMEAILAQKKKEYDAEQASRKLVD